MALSLTLVTTVFCKHSYTVHHMHCNEENKTSLFSGPQYLQIILPNGSVLSTVLQKMMNSSMEKESWEETPSSVMFFLEYLASCKTIWQLIFANFIIKKQDLRQHIKKKS